MAAILFGLIIGTALSVAPTSMLLHRLRELRQRLAEALWAAEHDGLTGLPNRRAFDNHAGRALATNPPGSRLVLALIDLDRFKVINDTYGHGIGDLVLHATARRLHERVGPGGLIARLGGGEVVGLMALAGHQTA